MSDAWVTDDDLRAARLRFTERIPGFVLPAAFTVARRDATGLTFGHLNGVGEVRPLSAVVLASVCDYVATTGVFPLDRERLADAVGRLAPAEAATHLPHPNLWSWRELLAGAAPDSTFVAIFVADAGDRPVDPDDAQFRRLLAG
ncbi:hypothetical protein [Polymorphospora sp. NPDC050346]|uniref:hypothetical protein n=1 Tax=Polymorphospora sp. NPDC050346 TaxID=3155780 RepID=UPI0033E2DB1D